MAKSHHIYTIAATNSLVILQMQYFISDQKIIDVASRSAISPILIYPRISSNAATNIHNYSTGQNPQRQKFMIYERSNPVNSQNIS